MFPKFDHPFVCTEWTPENLQRLFSAMKNSISDRDSNAPYAKVVKTFNWATVAFPPFSASDCKKKCMEVFRKVRYCLALRFFSFFCREIEIKLRSRDSLLFLCFNVFVFVF